MSKRQKGLTLRELWDDGVESGQIIGYLLYCGGLIKERRACTAREFLQLVDFTQIGREDLIIDHSPAEVMKTFIYKDGRTGYNPVLFFVEKKKSKRKTKMLRLFEEIIKHAQKSIYCI